MRRRAAAGRDLTETGACLRGLKVDFAGLPAALVEALKGRKVDLDDPASTMALLKADVVVGITGFFDPQGRMVSVGIQCALCHSTVDDAFVPDIGRRLDGWPNRDLDIGAVGPLAHRHDRRRNGSISEIPAETTGADTSTPPLLAPPPKTKACVPQRMEWSR